MRSATTPALVVTTIRLPQDKMDRLRAVAEGEHRTLSQEIRRLIDLRLAELDAPQNEAA
jgi:predicted DNA-binding protein